MRSEYTDRTRRFAGSDAYSVFNRSNLFAIQSRQRALLKALKTSGINSLSGLRILEIGCGSGGVLREYQWLGGDAKNLFGIDLLHYRLQEARQSLPEASLLNANGQLLPFLSNSFDLVLQYTAISSMLDRDLRREVCLELLRVVRPDGLIISYDFWLNPTNKQTLGFGRSEIRKSFPGCSTRFFMITLAPPISRRLVPISWSVAHFLENLKIFNSHYLVVITPNT